MTLMATIPYDDSRHLFRRYEPWECEEDSGYPFIWNEISEVRCEEKLFRCDDCGFAYLEDDDILTVHHCNLNKADCRRENLDVYCWLHHSQDHNSDVYAKDIRCKYCKPKQYFLGWQRLHRHIKGIHKPFELKIPEITLDKRPKSYVGRHRVLPALQQQQRLRKLWRD